MQHKELTYKIIGCAMKIHKERGNGFQEKIYQCTLAIDFRYSDISFSNSMSPRKSRQSGKP